MKQPKKNVMWLMPFLTIAIAFALVAVTPLAHADQHGGNGGRGGSSQGSGGSGQDGGSQGGGSGQGNGGFGQGGGSGQDNGGHGGHGSQGGGSGQDGGGGGSKPPINLPETPYAVTLPIALLAVTFFVYRRRMKVQ